MSQAAFAAVEGGIAIAHERARLLADDVANARTPGFVARDLAPAGSFGVAVERAVATSGATSTLEYAMGATARNAVTHRALVAQERAMLREFRSVAEESRR